jgi:imidazolonepropionase-like amidohydrolase
MKAIICKKLIPCSNHKTKDNAAIIIENQVITGIKSKTALKNFDKNNIINAEKFTVLPGLIDCHDHLGINMGDEEQQAKQTNGYTALVAAKNARTVLKNGITTLRDMGEQGFVDIDIKKAIEEGIVPGPRLLVSGKFICRSGGHAWFSGREADGTDDIRKAIREQVRQGADLIKLMISGGISTPGSSPLDADYSEEEIITAVEEAHRLGKKIAAHLYGGKGADWAIGAGIDSIEHGAYLTESQLKAMSKKGTFLVSTVGVMAAVSKGENVPEYMIEKCREVLQIYKKTLSNAKKYNVKVAVGVDEMHGELANEIMALSDAGYKNIEAIQAATKYAAELCGIENDIGTIQKGKQADLIAIEGDPTQDLESLKNVRIVVKGGEIVTL